MEESVLSARAVFLSFVLKHPSLNLHWSRLGIACLASPSRLVGKSLGARFSF